MEKDALLLDVPELARRLGWSEKAARRAVERGRFPVVRLGRRVFVPRQGLEELIASSTVPARG